MQSIIFILEDDKFVDFCDFAIAVNYDVESLSPYVHNKVLKRVGMWFANYYIINYDVMSLNRYEYNKFFQRRYSNDIESSNPYVCKKVIERLAPCCLQDIIQSTMILGI